MFRAMIVSMVLGVTCGASADWPQFRGPTGQGHADAEDLPLRWGPEKNVAWRTSVPGKGWSSPVLHAGRVYLTAAVREGEGHALAALCFDAKTGEKQWQTAVFRQDADAPGIHKKNSHASPTPVVDGGKLFVHFGHQGAACLSLEGDVVWSNDRFKYPPVHGNGGSPVLTDDAMIFTCDAARNPFVLALDCKTGKVKWRTPRDTRPKRAFSFATPLVIEVGGRKQVICPGSDAVFAYDPKTGKAIWRVDYPGGYSVVPRPVYGHGLVYVCSGFNKPVLYAIRPNGQGNVTQSHVAWKKTTKVPHTPSLLLVGDELHMVSDGGVASCVDAETGKVHWERRLGGSYSASPFHAGGRIYFQNEEGETVVIQAGKQYKELARNDLKQRTLASCAVGDGALFIRTETDLLRVQKP